MPTTPPEPTTPPAACLEIATFRTRAGVSRPALERLLGQAQAWLEAQPGFCSRRLAHDLEQDAWVDQVEWRSAEDARRAMAAYPAAPFAEAMNGAIDAESFRCWHAAPVATPRP